MNSVFTVRQRYHRRVGERSYRLSSYIQNGLTNLLVNSHGRGIQFDHELGGHKRDYFLAEGTDIGRGVSRRPLAGAGDSVCSLIKLRASLFQSSQGNCGKVHLMNIGRNGSLL